MKVLGSLLTKCLTDLLQSYQLIPFWSWVNWAWHWTNTHICIVHCALQHFWCFCCAWIWSSLRLSRFVAPFWWCRTVQRDFAQILLHPCDSLNPVATCCYRKLIAIDCKQATLLSPTPTWMPHSLHSISTEGCLKMPKAHMKGFDFKVVKVVLHILALNECGTMLWIENKYTTSFYFKWNIAVSHITLSVKECYSCVTALMHQLLWKLHYTFGRNTTHRCCKHIEAKTHAKGSTSK